MHVVCVELDRFGAYVTLLVPIVLVVTPLQLFPRVRETFLGICVRRLIFPH